MPSKKPASAAQSKIFEAGALILLLLMIPGNGSRQKSTLAVLHASMSQSSRNGLRVAIFAVLTAAALCAK